MAQPGADQIHSAERAEHPYAHLQLSKHHANDWHLCGGHQHQANYGRIDYQFLDADAHGKLQLPTSELTAR